MPQGGVNVPGRLASVYSPEQMQVTPIEDKNRINLKNEMAKQLAQSQAGLQQTQQRIGLPVDMKQFQEKGVKIGDAVVNQNLVDNAIVNQKKAVSELSRYAGLTDQASVSLFGQQANDKFNKMRMDLLKTGQAFNFELEKMGIKRQEKAAYAQALGSVAKNLAAAMFMI